MLRHCLQQTWPAVRNEQVNYFLPLRLTSTATFVLFFLRGSESDFEDINVLSVWVYFKSDAYFILWHHLLTSEIPISAAAPKWYIHNSEISVSEFFEGQILGRLAQEVEGPRPLIRRSLVLILRYSSLCEVSLGKKRIPNGCLCEWLIATCVIKCFE